MLVVHNYTDVTPALLEKAYVCFTMNAHRFRFEHLTKKYWLHLINRAVQTGNIDHVTENHPYKNPICSYL